MAFSHMLFIWVPRFARLRLRFALDDANFSSGFLSNILIALGLSVKI
jgi:hypothetical protein